MILYSIQRHSKSVTSARLKDALSQPLDDTVSLSSRYVCNSLTSPPALDLELTRKPIGDLIPQYWVSNRLAVPSARGHAAPGRGDSYTKRKVENVRKEEQEETE